MRIGIDLMGGDRPPVILFEAIERAVEHYPEMNFVVFVTQAALDEILSLPFFQFPRIQIEFQVIAEVINMQDDPVIAIREKKNSSLVLALKLLKKNYLDGFISTGNTGALIAGATLILSLLPGIKRPGLLATLPTEKGQVAIIDVGGNVACKSHHLLHFAEMGAAYQRCCLGISHPRVGLLNIGVESKKGTSAIRDAYQVLQTTSQNRLQFVGNVEGREVFQGVADVLITDGFTGNVLLKVSEGVSFFILNQLQQVLKEVPSNQREIILRSLQHQFDYDEYNGAIVCGVDHVVVKCHGESSAKGLFNGIQGAIQLVRKDFINQIKKQLSF